MVYPNTSRTRALAACLLAASSFSHAVQPESALGFEEALRLAQERSRQLAAQETASAAAREMAVVAAQRPDPTLKAGINNLPIDGPDRFSLSRDFMTMRSIGLMQELTWEDKRRLRAARFEREAELAQAGRDLALTKLQRNTALAWLERYFLERMRSLLAAQRGEAQLQVEAAQAAYRGGRGAQADIFLARSAVAQMDDRIAQAERQIEGATIALVRWVGEAGRAELGAAPLVDNVRLHAQALDAQLLGHPEIALMAKQEQVAQADASIAQANKRADWSVEFMASQRGSAYSNMVSLNFSVPLQWRREQRQNREVAAKLATVQQMRAEREETTRDHLAEIQAMLLEWRGNRERLARYNSTLIPLAGERTQAAIAAYRGGTGTLKSVLEGRRDESDLRAERLRLEMDIARLWAQLNFLIPANHSSAPPARAGKTP
ncbi:MAG: TolC family protein [Betaproteobacteria bacterium]|nr:TolC family protein [Betaproteobacteria bacterium]